MKQGHPTTQSAFFWRGAPSEIGKLLSPGAKQRQDIQRPKYSPLVEGAEAGQRAADRRDAIRRGGR